MSRGRTRRRAERAAAAVLYLAYNTNLFPCRSRTSQPASSKFESSSSGGVAAAASPRAAAVASGYDALHTCGFLHFTYKSEREADRSVGRRRRKDRRRVRAAPVKRLVARLPPHRKGVVRGRGPGDDVAVERGREVREPGHDAVDLVAVPEEARAGLHGMSASASPRPVCGMSARRDHSRSSITERHAGDAWIASTREEGFRSQRLRTSLIFSTDLSSCMSWSPVE